MGKLISFAVNDAVMTPEEIEKAQFQKIHFRIYSNPVSYTHLDVYKRQS